MTPARPLANVRRRLAELEAVEFECDELVWLEGDPRPWPAAEHRRQMARERAALRAIELARFAELAASHARTLEARL